MLIASWIIQQLWCFIRAIWGNECTCSYAVYLNFSRFLTRFFFAPAESFLSLVLASGLTDNGRGAKIESKSRVERVEGGGIRVFVSLPREPREAREQKRGSAPPRLRSDLLHKRSALKKRGKVEETYRVSFAVGRLGAARRE